MHNSVSTAMYLCATSGLMVQIFLLNDTINSFAVTVDRHTVAAPKIYFDIFEIIMLLKSKE